MILEEKLQCTEYLATVWKALMDESIPMPAERQFLLWLTAFTPEIVEEGISVAANKVMAEIRKGQGLTSDRVLRYASGVMRNVHFKGGVTQ